MKRNNYCPLDDSFSINGFILTSNTAATSDMVLIKNLTSKKKNRQKRKGGGRFSIYSALVWTKSNLSTETVFQTITFHKYDLRSIFYSPKQIWRGCLAFIKCVCDVRVGGVVSGGSSPKFFLGLNSVKSCNFRRNKHGNTLSWKPGILCMTMWEKGLGTWKWLRFFKHLLYVQYWRAKRARKSL